MASLAYTDVPNSEPGTIFTRRDRFNIGPGNTAILLKRCGPSDDDHAQLLLLNEQRQPFIVVPATGKDAHNIYNREFAPSSHCDTILAGWGFIKTGDGNYVPANPRNKRIKGFYEGYAAAAGLQS